MLVNGTHYRTVWLDKNNQLVKIIDQRVLPHQFKIECLDSVQDIAIAIKDMHIRGAGSIGAIAGFGMYLAIREAIKRNSKGFLSDAAQTLLATRPTAVNLSWAIELQKKLISQHPFDKNLVAKSRELALKIADFDADCCKRIGKHGLNLIKDISRKKNGEPVNILTHCNAGWLAFVDYGTALSPIFEAKRAGIPVHVWVDETRPRNQGARLTAWELVQEKIPHTVISDNTGGHLMQHRLVDMVITGSDRTTHTGDVANKIGTYLKALAAFDNNIPFYAALPSSTIDWELEHGIKEIPIEQRNGKEVTFITGLLNNEELVSVRLTPEESQAANYGFDVTPSRLVTGIITENGICQANKESIRKLHPKESQSFDI